MPALSAYFKDLRGIYNTGSAVKETSYYSAFEAMANAYGKELKPRVRCVINLKNKGAGIPDAGFFAASQFQRGEEAPREGQLPERGCAEIKSTKDDVEKIAANEQVEKYLNHYGAVLVTNYRDFLLIGVDAHGKAERLERFSFAESETEFWREVSSDASAFAERFETSFDEFIKRVFLYAVPLTKPEDVAWFLASYAREAKERVERAKNLDALESLRKTMEEALGITFRAEEGERFFSFDADSDAFLRRFFRVGFVVEKTSGRGEFRLANGGLRIESPDDSRALLSGRRADEARKSRTRQVARPNE